MNTAWSFFRSQLLLPVFFGLLAALTAARRERDRRDKPERKYAPVWGTYVLPFLLFIWLPFLALVFRWSFEFALLMLVNLMLGLFVYSMLLLALTPLLRRRISARGLASLWSLPDYYLTYGYLSMILYGARKGRLISIPRLTLRLSRNTGLLVFGIWIIGFLGVLGWKILSHLRFRKALLRDAEPLSDREIALFTEVRTELRAIEPYMRSPKVLKKLRFYRSPAAETPLSVGVFSKKTCLVLPRREYSDEELRLVFRHEIIHLLHGDNDLKFNVTFLCATGWFLPCLWGGMRKAAEEQELCCDELAVEGLNEEDRRRYAGLLLDAAGPAPGFTTCLSASASGLRYRLGRVLRPEKRRFGVFLIAGISALFAFCYGFVGFALEAGSFRSEVLDRDGGGWQVCRVFPYGLPTTEEASTNAELCRNTEALLAELALDETPDVDLRSDHQLGVIWLTRDGGAMAVAVYDTGMVFYPKGEEGGARIVFLYRSPVDLTPIFAAAGESE